MTLEHDVDTRLTGLEVKASLTEDLVDRLNDAIVRQQAQIDLLMREVKRLSQRVDSGDDRGNDRGNDSGNDAGPRSLRDELPPHY
jgi:SlyX protein